MTGGGPHHGAVPGHETVPGHGTATDFADAFARLPEVVKLP